MEGTHYKYEITDRLTQDDIETLKNDVKLKSMGVNFHYIIDSYDVLEYCFPLGVRFDKRDKSVDRIGDENRAYSYLFNHNKPILLDEYKIELDKNEIAFLNTLTRKSTFLEQFFDNYVERTNDVELLLNELEETVSFIALCVQQDTALGLPRLYELKKSLIKHEISESSPKREIILANYFSEARRNVKYTEIFRAWCNENYEIKDKTVRIIEREIESLRRDFKACAMVQHINQISVEEVNKDLFLYFSSAPRSKKILSENLRFDRTINGIEVKTLLRDQRHSFIMYLTHDDNYENWLINLDYIKAFLPTKERTFKNEPFFTEFDKFLISKFQNDAIVKQLNDEDKFEPLLNETKESIQEFRKSRGNKDEKEYYASIIKGINELSKKLNNAIDSLDKSSAYVFQKKSIEIESAWNNIKKELRKYGRLHRQMGADYIRGSYHHLPIFILVTYSEDSALCKLVYSIDRYLTGAEKPDEEKHLVKGIISFIDSRYDIDRYELEPHQRFIMRLFLNIILPKENRLDYLTHQRQLLDYMAEGEIIMNEVNRMMKQNDDEHTKKLYQNIYLDYLYIGSWLARRCAAYDVAERFAIEGKVLDRDDPRFYHSLSLIEFCNFMALRSNSYHEVEQIDQIIGNLKKSVERYKNLGFRKASDLILSTLINGTVEISIFNTIKYLLSIKYLILYNSPEEYHEFPISLIHEQILGYSDLIQKADDFLLAKNNLEIQLASNVANAVSLLEDHLENKTAKKKVPQELELVIENIKKLTEEDHLYEDYEKDCQQIRAAIQKYENIL